MDVVPATQMPLFPKSKMDAFSVGVPVIPKDPLLLFTLSSAYQEINRPKNTEIIFVGLVDEEFGQEGSRALAQKGPKADLAIAGEPKTLRLYPPTKEIFGFGRKLLGNRPMVQHPSTEVMQLIKCRF